ncbi:tuberous sclerosis 2 protein [Podospora conica]|nr:tuberous sclerosis 2 protein [Schizothecium conicum]
MFRRLASSGHSASDDQQHMPPSPGDEPPAHEPKTAGGLAGVFKGLAGGRLARSPPPLPTTASHDRIDGASHRSIVRGLPPDQMGIFGHLKNGTLNERVAAANSLRHAIADFPLNPVLDIWEAGKDLIEPSKPAAARHAGWELLTKCVKYPSSTDLERSEYFQTLTQPANPEDFHLQLAALEDLTNHGRNVAGFYYDIFPLLTSWLSEWYNAVKRARRQLSRSNSKSAKGKTLPMGEDKNLSQLFTFLKDVIKFNFKFASDSVVATLVGLLLKICMSTSVEEDLRSCINVIDALVTFGTIPNDKVKECVHVLSSIHCLVPSLQKEAWHVISNICRSHHGQSTVRILLDVLRKIPATAHDEAKEKEVVRTVRGALSVLKKLLHKSAEKGYPVVPLTLLIDGLAKSSQIRQTRISIESLKLINSLFEDSHGGISALVAEEHWSPIFLVATRCAQDAIHAPAAKPEIHGQAPLLDDPDFEDSIASQLRILIGRMERMLAQNPNFIQREECMHFLIEVQHALPDSAATLVIDYFRENRSCFPSEAEWEKNINLVVDCFYSDKNRRALTRLQALEIIVNVYGFLSLVQDVSEEQSIKSLIRRLLAGLPDETDSLVLQRTVSFLVDVAETASPELFGDILGHFRAVVFKNMIQHAAPSPSGPKLLSNVVTKGYVQIFIRSMNHDASKAAEVFTALVKIARTNACEVDARLTALKLLFRVRADSQHRIYLTSTLENESLAESLYRTEASLARKLAEDAAQPPRLSRAEQTGSRPSRGVSFTQSQPDRGTPLRPSQTSSVMPHQGQRLWSLPDLEAFPEPPPASPSPVLSAYQPGDKTDAPSLDVQSWLPEVLGIFHQGCDWEVYAFALVHLPAQLSNHTLFAGALPQIRDARKILCELIRSGPVPDPPIASGLRRPDVINCLLHSAVMMLSYHEHFQKTDEDDLIRTFMHGISEKTAKICIHALSVCCHEMPTCMSKSLVTILQRMSQVITQPLVAMHILEFLACLSRMPVLYSNFRDDEYRIVFAICFRYLQYVRERKHAARGPYASEPSTPSAGGTHHGEGLGQQSTSDDLPQYVYALAYHVITFWFLAVKMPERPIHITWITKNLFTDVDGSPTNEEQAQITLDFMQRVAFSDASDSAEDPLFKKEYFGEMQQKRWIIGNSIVTIRQAVEAGWAEITRRYPSGTSSFAIRVEFPPPVAIEEPSTAESAPLDGRFQQGTTIFPSHLLMQILAPLPQIHDAAIRPIVLPNDSAVERAIKMFDRNSTVDGHKIGVIYIGEGQTDEAEILANTIGSPDYLELLRGLGSLVKLKGAPFNTQGLDRSADLDGKYTYCWRDRVTEIVFHVTTMMPTNLENDPRCNNKKSHIGNDYVNIVFNDSGRPFRFDTFPSQFNYVYIIITPTPRISYVSARSGAAKRQEGDSGPSPFYMIQVMSQPGFPEISPAAEPKLVSLKALPGFVRLLAINASVFSAVWANREGGEHISSWRNRLQEINRLRERYAPKPAPSPPPSSLGGGISAGALGGGQGQMDSPRPVSGVRDSFGSSLRRSSVATFWTNNSADPGQQSHRSSMVSATTTENTEIMPNGGAEALVGSVDFSKWT